MRANKQKTEFSLPDKTAIVLDKIEKTFNKQIVLSDFSAVFDETGIYVITGKSGSGKTTLLRIIAGLDRDFAGSITGGGIENCAMAFQEYRLFPSISAFENVYAVTKGTDSERTKSSMDALLSVGFDADDFEKLPSELSGGMKQRVSLARAIAADKPILLLDEPTKELDSTLRKKLYETLLNLSKRKLIIMVTHLSEDIESLSDNIITLEKPTEQL